MRKDHRTWHDDKERVPLRDCDHPDCGEPGEFRAPVSRDRLHEYRWFCLDHVREYNKAWNYYAGMTEREVEAETRRDTTWHRPTWPLGAQAGGYRRFMHSTTSIHDGFGMFGDGDAAGARRESRARMAGVHPESAEAQALVVMDIEPPLTLTRLKARYKELVKLNHPDANGGDKLAEERLKGINEAYAMLRKLLSD
ncbi:MAG: J domain-containing protein [Rhodospirillales bacterium]|nr:MAG: J domain-containing protein [Rhodospirillales bacterium]